MRRRLLHSALGGALAALAAAAVCAADAPVTGKVVDESGLVVAAARVSLEGAALARAVFATTDEAGRFTLAGIPPGSYRLRVEKQGFYAFVSEGIALSDRPPPLEITLNHEQAYEETVSVVYNPPIIDREETAAQQTLTSETILNIPYVASHDFRNSLTLMPGVVKDNNGRIHLNGGGEDQAFYTLDGFNITSPVSGILENRLSVEALRAVRVETSRYSAEYGKGSAGTMALESLRGDDHFRFAAANFLPSYEFHNGLGVSNWNPRATISGPIRKGRAWYSNAIDAQYDLNIIDRLPSDANTNRNWTGSDLTRLQFNITPRNVLTATFLFNFRNLHHLGITPLDPVETSQNRHERFYFFNVKDQFYFSGGWVLETGAAVNQINTRVRPLGDELYRISPKGRSGNYFLSSRDRVQRIQGLANVMAPPRTARGQHLLKFGIDADSILYRENATRNPFQIQRNDGVPSRLVSFSGNPRFLRQSVEFASYAQDRWSISDRVLVETGTRLDWDEILRRPVVSPRLSATWGPSFLPDMKLSAGVGLFYDATNLRLLTRELGQQRSDLFYGDDGGVLRGPISSVYHADERRLKAPRYLNWSVGWEQRLPRSFYLRSNFIRKNGRNGWSYQMHPSGSLYLFELENLRHDSYRYLEFTLNRTFAGRYPWLLSYARSRARSSAVIDFTLENPVFARQQGGPLDWDAPNRVISWGTSPIPRLQRMTLAYFFEWRSGFPYSVVDEHQSLIGSPNSSRFPDYLSLNLHLERRFRLWRVRWALRGGFNNITAHTNAVAVTNNIDSPDFGRFYGGQGRVFTGRIRFLGRN